MEICSRQECTACGACVNSCPKSCITWEKDDLGALYPIINESNCIHCDSCIRACPNNNDLQFNRPIKTFAAWSVDEENRRTSASGGVVSVFYQYTLRKGGFTCGAELTLDKGVNYIRLEKEEDVERVKNSKYVFSHTNDIFRCVKLALKEGQFAFFVGLPCQVAGLKSYLGKLANADNLLLADIICHGVSNEDYLFQFLHYIENKKKRKADSMYFRDPAFGTESYVFTLRANTYDSVTGSQKNSFSPDGRKTVFYSQNHYGSNLYYIGYMNGLIYRENCYQCHYARTERISDLTFGDFDGLGKEIPFSHRNRQVSLCLVNTTKGEQYLKEVSDELFLEERNLGEAVKSQMQLKAPAKRHPNRNLFVQEYKKRGDFVESAKKALKKEVKGNKINNIINILLISPILKITTKRQINIIKKILGR